MINEDMTQEEFLSGGFVFEEDTPEEEIANIISRLKGFKDFKNTNFEDFNTIDFLSVILSQAKEIKYLKEQEEQAFLMGLKEK